MPSRPTVYAFLAVVALLVMFAMIARGGQKTASRVTADFGFSASKILGLMDRVPGREAGSAIEQFIQNGADEAKDLAAAKVLEAKTVVVEALKKEVTRLTEAQIKQLTIQLCKDWGVIASSSAATP